MHTERYACDHCEADLTTTGARPTYRLTLYAQKLPHTPDARGLVTIAAVHVTPPLSGVLHFCGLDHLRAWLAER